MNVALMLMVVFVVGASGVPTGKTVDSVKNTSLILSQLQLKEQNATVQTNLERQFQELREEMQQRQHEEEQRFQELEQTKEQMHAMAQHLRQLEQKLHQVQNDHQDTNRKTAPPVAKAANAVAFTATQETTEILELEAGTTMSFPTVSLAEGSGYDPATSIFTCPVTGIYYFAAAVAGGKYVETFRESDNSFTYIFEEAVVAITKDDVNQVGAEVGDSWDTNRFFSPFDNVGSTASASVVVNCAAGSRVQVKATKLSYITCPPPLSCSFTGYLVEQLA